MKSSFLLTLLIASLANVAHAQMSLRPSPKDMVPNTKTHFEKFSDRLKISYFGVFTSPHFDDIEKGQWRNAAIAPAEGNDKRGEQKNHDTWAANLWNQVSFNFNFGAKMNFVINPRFVIPLAYPKDMSTSVEDKSLVMLDDFLVGFQGVVYSSEDKKFNLWIRPGVRIPTSHSSRVSNNANSYNAETKSKPFGTTTHQIELGLNPTYDFNKTWQLGGFGQLRSWIYEDRYNWSRARIYAAPYIQYTIDDTTRIQTYYEFYMENRRNWKSINGRAPVWKDYWQNAYVAFSKDITPKFNVMPFLSCYVDDHPITDKSLWVGAWISYQIK